MNESNTPHWLYLPIETLPFGAPRRKRIMDAFDKYEGARYAVNCKYRPQMKADKDLQRLVKEGKLVMRREQRSSVRSKRSYLTKP